MNSPQQSTRTNNAGRETLGVIAKLIAVIAATFAFAAFSSGPAQPQSSADGGQAASAQTPHHSR